MDQAGNREKSVSALDNYAAAIGELRAAIGANISIRRFGLLLALADKPGSTLAELMEVTKDAQTTVWEDLQALMAPPQASGRYQLVREVPGEASEALRSYVLTEKGERVIKGFMDRARGLRGPADD